MNFNAVVYDIIAIHCYIVYTNPFIEDLPHEVLTIHFSAVINYFYMVRKTKLKL